MSKIRTHYDNLKVARNAPPEVIRAAYKTLSQKYHPDRNGNSAESQRVMRIINNSYDVLSDEKRRAEHDRWISRQESGATAADPASQDDQEVVPTPKSGACYFSELSSSQKAKIASRVKNNDAQNYFVKTDGVIANYFWSAVLLGWFVFVYILSTENRWTDQTIYWLGGITVIATYLLGRNVSWIYAWHKTPLKSRLIVTPIYIIRTCLDQISYWPLWTLRDIKTTHNYKNGSYQSTSLVMNLEGKSQDFTIRSKSESEEFLEQLQLHSRVCQHAAKNGDTNYFRENDDFISLQNDAKKKVEQSLIRKPRLLVYVLIGLSAAVFFSYAWQENSDNPVRVAKPKQPYNSNPSSAPSYQRPATAPNGSPWPSRTSYVAGYQKFNTGGLSNVTVDNTRNDSDVFVKLVDVSGREAFPVRVFYISGGESFKVSGIKAGEYDVRYRDLSSGGLARSESFTLEETFTGRGTQYSDLRMTLYKVRDGNMRTYPLSEAEF